MLLDRFCQSPFSITFFAHFCNVVNHFFQSPFSISFFDHFFRPLFQSLFFCEGDGDVVGVFTPLRGVAQVVLHGVQVVEVGVQLRVRQDRGVEEEGEGQVEVEREEVEVKERRSCVKMGWNEDSRTPWANEVCMTQHQDKQRLRALRAVLTGAACACRGPCTCACWCSLCHDSCPHRSCWCCSCCRYSSRSHFLYSFSVVEMHSLHFSDHYIRSLLQCGQSLFPITLFDQFFIRFFRSFFWITFSFFAPSRRMWFGSL